LETDSRNKGRGEKEAISDEEMVERLQEIKSSPSKKSKKAKKGKKEGQLGSDGTDSPSPGKRRRNQDQEFEIGPSSRFSGIAKEGLEYIPQGSPKENAQEPKQSPLSPKKKLKFMKPEE
jgi:hypothetical protein